MASFASSSVFSPFFSQPKLNLYWNSSSSSSYKPTCSSSKSSFFQYGFSFPAAKSSGSSLKSKNMGNTIYARAATEKTIYDFTVKDIDGKDVPLSTFKGKVLLIVNVASRCGLTTSNYTELSRVYEKYKSQGLEILAFPCNQFGAQEPGSNPEIKQFACTRFKAEFPIFDKVDVNGPNTAPVYQFLKSSAGGFLGDLVKWNFEKFLVDKNGKVVERYPPTTSPFQIEVHLKEKRVKEEAWERDMNWRFGVYEEKEQNRKLSNGATAGASRHQHKANAPSLARYQAPHTKAKGRSHKPGAAQGTPRHSQPSCRLLIRY